ncbi:uncharacterized protein LOC108914340 isoform X2 [Anoplophora glabripennis]|uniref:uncharacterized protein LOC108914340 isoform X2 n=1 Tax=Anoplophora glabripennis TaxID=217634 RepID=UPI000C77BD4E|nr:uncharacterized protein LOC108914340 isoform X2 [Anoplophora glabripennis]
MKQFWEIIANLMNEELPINVTDAQCENRWRVLKRNYKKYVCDNNKKTGRDRKTFEYAEEFDEIFGRKRNIHPELLLTEDSAIEIQTSNAVSESNGARYDVPSTSQQCEESEEPALPYAFADPCSV